jgi:hypothetical protein
VLTVAKEAIVKEDAREKVEREKKRKKAVELPLSLPT